MKNYPFNIAHLLSCVVLILVLIAVSCSTKPGSSTTALQKLSLRPEIKLIERIRVNGLQQKKELNNSKSDDDGLTLDDVIKGIVSDYSKEKLIDTSILNSKLDTLTIKVRHFCTYDQNIHIPHRFIAIYGRQSSNTTEFTTNNFNSDFKLFINSKIITVGKITKNDFRSVIKPQDFNISVLQDPNLKISNGGFVISYVIGIPLTDIGLVESISIDSTGKKRLILIKKSSNI